MKPTANPLPVTETGQHDSIRSFYQLHAGIYDLTRWAFLFGRNRILRDLPAAQPRPSMILEIGCGTGRNLLRLGKLFPGVALAGVDVSSEMTAKAKKNLSARNIPAQVHTMPYRKGETMFTHQPDIILFSYSLSMMNPQWEELLNQAQHDLRPGGLLAVVDFHHSRFAGFRRHMARNHVRMEAHLLPALEKLFVPVQSEIHKAYAGWWTWFTFLGRKA